MNMTIKIMEILINPSCGSLLLTGWFIVPKLINGITGTTIKATWTKSRGRVEVGEGGGFGWGGVEGWGGKAYNCN